MPQLDTSTWLITILSMIITLFVMFQTKTSMHSFFTNPQQSHLKMMKQKTPWEKKWTKIYSPLLSHQQY
ncbi:ATP synthase F0 subunit 8 (mitochondrion) [Octodon degus]|uniref:ATP synthase complex subunit 8 n=1 Tax=Octodon degus TaxID=10160 RepID=G3CHD6_OCTDE|nr:ATP synthase F0 subunit 8 [Octodon degus]ADK72627.1 ATP synthase F0 subunit 8 [Octodon degus]